MRRVRKWNVRVFFGIFLLSFAVVWLTVSLISAKTRSYEVARIIDGDTIMLSNGEKVRLLGIDAPDSGSETSGKTTVILETMLDGNKVWVEGDRYKKDQYGRRLGWLWIKCESEPDFKPENFMEKVYLKNRGNTYAKWVEENPVGCRGGVLVNEELLKMGVAKLYFVEGEGELKYEERLKTMSH